jgi:Predicted signal transduction protein with a C-terminal ATPase domain
MHILGRSSIGTKLVIAMLAVALPLGTLLVTQNIYAISTLHDKVAATNSSLVTLYMGQIDQGLNYVDLYLNSLIARDISILSLDTLARSDEDAYQLAKIAIQTELSTEVTFFSGMEALFVYNERKDEFVEAFNGDPSYDEKRQARTKIRAMAAAGLSSREGSAWLEPSIGPYRYFLRIKKLEGTYIGAWGSPQRLLMPLELLNIGSGGRAFFASSSGEPLSSEAWAHEQGLALTGKGGGYYLTGIKEEYLVVSSRSRMGAFSLVAAIPDSAVRAGMPSLLGIILWLSIFWIALIPASLLFARATLLKPLGRMIEAMRSIQGGDLDTRMRTTPSSTEFAIVDSTFNGMMERIRDLKIDVYEERINAQRAELKQLQLQVKPHFYLNSLNVIYHMAQLGEFALIQEMAQRLVDYYRYSLRTDESFVSLGEELEHARNYYRIQEIRLAGEHSLVVDAPTEALTASVPPLLVQTFVENSAKYGLCPDGSLRVRIEVRLVREGERLSILVRDEGPGFDEAALEELRRCENEPTEGGGKVGIWNIRRRLALLYHGAAALRFDNASPGAAVSIEVPFTE